MSLLIAIHNQNFLLALLACVSAGLILGHNLWLIAKRERHSDDDSFLIEANTSDSFPASDSAVRPERIADFRLVSSEGSTPIKEYRVEGKSLVAPLTLPRAGNYIAALTLHPHPITLEAEKFGHYIADEAAMARVASRFRIGETTTPQRESYAKYAKALIKGNAQNDDLFRRAVDHRLEIIPQNNLSAQRDVKLQVQVLFDGEPVAGLRVSCGCEHLNEGRYAAHTATDDNGRAAIEVSTPGHWFIRAHYIRPHQDSQTVDWESFWASLTFHISE